MFTLNEQHGARHWQATNPRKPLNTGFVRIRQTSCQHLAERTWGPTTGQATNPRRKMLIPSSNILNQTLKK